MTGIIRILVMACGLAACALPAQAEETVFGILLGDPNLSLTMPDRRRNRALMSHWTPSIRDHVRFVRVSEPLPPLKYYMGRRAVKMGKVCYLMAFSDPFPAEQSAKLLKPILLSVTNHFEEIHGRYRNRIEEPGSARLRLRDWDAIVSRIEEEGARYQVIAQWPTDPSNDAKLNDGIKWLGIGIYVDPDRRLRAGVEALVGDPDRCNYWDDGEK
ncbi:MAG: hypothetical protein J0I42_10590 [Bosea sp.]|uniref:hypothetical protein n=1 Tax=Bosea sp. (in: a-proteobacteria) TaxID=1871050 RepID=UPI001ACBF27A|nr:hypothetical protein [Bosea sp. (in: a-proteobacteria)]MBN9452382.1 hypothetical protein [Bosea sp. (in: a-proteobacteria)]